MFHSFTAALQLAFVLGATPIDVSSQKQLFIDDRFIAVRDRIELNTHEAQKLGPIVEDATGERLQGHISRVIDDGGKVRLYLGAEELTIYESDDGLKFRKTDDTIRAGTFPTIFVDPHEVDPARRYKLFHLQLSQPFNSEVDGVYASASADGLHFEKVGRVLPFFTDNPPIAHWDARINKYVVYVRAFDYGSENQRRVGRIETDDLLKPWPFTKTDNERLFPSIENIPVVLSADGEDDPHSDIYYNASAIYPWAADAHLMFTSQFRHFSPDRNPYVRPRESGKWEDFGMLETQLAVSRDGIHWSRPNREPYFPTGLSDEWDRWYAVTAPGLIRRGSHIYQYYYSSGRLHDSAFLRPEYEHTASQTGGVGIVRQRLDGFVSADADHKGGSLTTPLVIFKGRRLRLNIDTGAMGTAFVELRNEDGQPIPGFTLGDCEEIGGNFIDQDVHWKGGTDVSSLAGGPVQIHIRMKRAKLYAFQFTEE